MNKEFDIIRKKIQTKTGTEIVIQKKYKMNNDQNKNRVWVFQPKDPLYIEFRQKMKGAGLWN